MAQFQQQLLGYLPPALREIIGGGAGRDLLKKVNATLLVFDDQLWHVETGRSVSLQQTNPVNATGLAAAARPLLAPQKEPVVMLLLPPAEFVATTRSMPGVNRDSLASALSLQTDSLLPACDKALAMAINPASADAGDEHVALWLPQARLVELFTAFAGQELFLATVRPRVFNVTPEAGRNQLVDCDSQDSTAVVTVDGILRRWLAVKNLDLEQEAFAEQWQRQVFGSSTMITREVRAPDQYLAEKITPGVNDYCFFPPAALSARKKVEKGRQLLLAAAAVAGLMFLGSVPFILQSLEFRRAAAALEANRGMSVEARQDQAAVVDFENRWGAISDFPQQNVRQALFTLQNVLSPEQLTNLELSEGLIKIQGTSNDPQAILQRLEQDPLFTEVVFSRATNNTRYYIDLRLSPVNFEAYMVRYFPDD